MPRLLLPLAAVLLAAPSGAADLRLGLIGTDTSHVIAFTEAFNGAPGPDHVDGARVVAAFKGGSPDVEASFSRVDRFAEQLRSDWGIAFVDEIASLCPLVDALLLESVDGRTHLEQARQALACRKPIFIDKPLASTLADAREIARLAREAGVPWFSSSSLRWSEIVTTLRRDDTVGVSTWGPGPTEPHHQLDLSWYAIHPIEMLFALMGPGCLEVTRTASDSGDVVLGRWADGRLGTVRVLPEARRYGAVVFRPDEVEHSRPGMRTSYTPMLREIVEFFRTGQPPVPNEETLEIFAFMDAAQRSAERGGAPVRLILEPRARP
jgi:predicted dehydrogenase